MFCKNCGAYMAAGDVECDECGAINGVSQIQMHKEGIKPEDIVPQETRAEPKDDVVNLQITSLSEDIMGNDTPEVSFFEFDDVDKGEQEESVSLLSYLEAASAPNTDIEIVDFVAENNDLQQVSESEKTVEIQDELDDLDDEADMIKSHDGRNDEAILSSKPSENSTSIPASETVIYSADKKPKRTKSNSKIFIIIIAVLIAAFAAYIAMTKGAIPSPFGSDNNTTTSQVVTTELTTTVPVYDAYSYAEVYLTTANGARNAIEGIVNGYDCGVVKSFDVISDDGKAVIKTEDYEIVFRLKNTSLDRKYFDNKSVTVVGSALYDTISAEQIYLYDASEVTTSTTDPMLVTEPFVEQTTEFVPSPSETDAPTEAKTTVQTTVKTTKKTTTKPKTTTSTTAAITTVSVKYISADEAEKLMNEWRADGSKLGSSNAYFGTIRSAIITSDGDVHVKTAGYRMVFKPKEAVDVNDLIERNILVVGKPQSDSSIRASQVYIY